MYLSTYSMDDRDTKSSGLIISIHRDNMWLQYVSQHELRCCKMGILFA
jgi:hypothetical protein